jgi:CheY-like chemotaxis protein
MKNSNEQAPTILIVEDLDWLRISMKRSVERCGYRVVEAKSDRAAFEVAAREVPELILTEEELPNFKALVAGLRQHPTLGDVPVVIINPDATAVATRAGHTYTLPDYEQLALLLASQRP